MKAAYFLGHVELLGLGQGTSTSTSGSLATIGMWTSTDSAQNNIVKILPGETYAQRVARVNASSFLTLTGTITTTASTLPGNVVVLAGESLAHIANINGVTLFELMRANNLTTTVNPATGTRLLIPRH